MSACATEDYVDHHVGLVNARVDETNSKVDALSGRVQTVAQGAQAAGQHAEAAYALASTKSEAKFNYADTNQGASVTFDTNKWALTDEAQATLTALAEKLKTANKDVYVEIVGHGDPRGSVMANRVLGAKRSLEVQRFLAGQGVALGRLSVVSWGEEKTANPNDRSPEALQANRRVDVIVKG
ncbi:MAG: OmpA family protein [Phenylobacterium sp.]